VDQDDEQEPSESEVFTATAVPVAAALLATSVATAIAIKEPEPCAAHAFESMSAPVEAQDFAPLAHQVPDNVVGTLESWLENIRRIKACR
jgi:hypothetical protein